MNTKLLLRVWTMSDPETGQKKWTGKVAHGIPIFQLFLLVLFHTVHRVRSARSTRSGSIVTAIWNLRFRLVSYCVLLLLSLFLVVFIRVLEKTDNNRHLKLRISNSCNYWTSRSWAGRSNRVKGVFVYLQNQQTKNKSVRHFFFAHFRVRHSST